MKVLCKIYKSSSKADFYLYVKYDEDVSRVPEALLGNFGKYELAMTLALTPDRKLVSADAVEVLSALEEKGYFIQLPPQRLDPYMQDVCAKNEKL